MLGNDTWFMYEQSKMDTLNADGFMNAGGYMSADAKAVLDCANLPKTKFCKKHPASPICIGRIKQCEKHNAKVESLRGEAAQAKGIAATLQTDAEETAANTAASSSTAAAGGGDNMMTYLAIGGVAILALGGLAVFLLRKKATVAPVAV